MSAPEFCRETPWDERAFGFATYELEQVSNESLRAISGVQGHFTAKVDPLFPKGLLHDYGFYYCDTLIEPYCAREQFRGFRHDLISINWEVNLGELLSISHGVFEHGRFHRDFNLDKALADLRYDNWLNDLIASRNCMALLLSEETAGYFGVNGSRIVLHALSAKYKGRGLAKYFWSAACQELFSQGHNELSSSISASNLAVLNLYISLGFKFRNACDVYHLMNP